MRRQATTPPRQQKTLRRQRMHPPSPQRNRPQQKQRQNLRQNLWLNLSQRLRKTPRTKNQKPRAPNARAGGTAAGSSDLFPAETQKPPFRGGFFMSGLLTPGVFMSGADNREGYPSHADQRLRASAMSASVPAKDSRTKRCPRARSKSAPGVIATFASDNERRAKSIESLVNLLTSQ